MTQKNLIKRVFGFKGGLDFTLLVSIFTLTLALSVVGIIKNVVGKNPQETHHYINYLIWASISFGFYLLYSASQIRVKSHVEYIKALESFKASADSFSKLLAEKADLQSQYIKELKEQLSLLSSHEEEFGKRIDEIRGDFEVIKEKHEEIKKSNGTKTNN